MIKKAVSKYSVISAFFISLFMLLIFVGCSSREKQPVILNDSTLVYPVKYEKGILPKITLSNKISRKTGQPINAGTVFMLKDKSKLYASVDLENQFGTDSSLHMFHIDWIDSSGNSFYKKRIDFNPLDSIRNISSIISLSPDKRKTGNYSIRLYLFRELIAEKKFQLINYKSESSLIKKKELKKSKKKPEKRIIEKKSPAVKEQAQNISASILLCRELSAKTGNPVGTDSTFTIKEKANVKAVVTIEKQEVKANEQLKFYFQWFGPDGKLFYKKRIVYTTSNKSFTITNSISITPGKRRPGNYKLVVIFKKKIIAKQKFELVSQE